MRISESSVEYIVMYGSGIIMTRSARGEPMQSENGDRVAVLREKGVRSRRGRASGNGVEWIEFPHDY